MQDIQKEAAIRKYLFGYSEPEMAEAIEERLVTDQDYLQTFSIIKEELVEDYLNGDLSAEEVERFKNYFLMTPDRHRKLEITRALAERANNTPAPVSELRQPNERLSFPSRSRWRGNKHWLLAAMISGIVIAAFAVWVKLKSPPVMENANNEANKQLRNEIARLNDPHVDVPEGNTVQQRKLSPVTVRSIGEDRRLLVQPNTQTIVLELVLADHSYHTYRASLQNAEGAELAEFEAINPTGANAGQFVEVRLPAQLLQSRSYQIKLTGLASDGKSEPIAAYPFQLIKI
jgi:hypothetical protein